MHASYDDFTRSRPDRGPAIYFGYCTRTGRYRMMDLPEYVSTVQEGVSRWFSDAATMYQDITRGYYGPMGGYARGGVRARFGRDRECDDCHCECCVCDADVLVHARCNEVRRIPVTFENDTRRERQIKLELGKFMTAGGRELDWKAQLSETEFTLRSCDEHTVTAAVQVRCEAFGGETPPGSQPGGTNQEKPGAAATNTRGGSVDRCEVAYARLRADGCLIRPVVLAVAVLPDNCDAYRRPCSCGCCH
jgi:hypothetical protein